MTPAIIQFLLNHNRAILWTTVVVFAIVGLFVPHFGSFLIGYAMSGFICLLMTVDVIATAFKAGQKSAKDEMLRESFK